MTNLLELEYEKSNKCFSFKVQVYKSTAASKIFFYFGQPGT